MLHLSLHLVKAKIAGLLYDRISHDSFQTHPESFKCNRKRQETCYFFLTFIYFFYFNRHLWYLNNLEFLETQNVQFRKFKAKKKLWDFSKLIPSGNITNFFIADFTIHSCKGGLGSWNQGPLFSSLILTTILDSFLRC